MKFTQMPQQPVKLPAYAELPPLEEFTLEEFKELPDSVPQSWPKPRPSTKKSKKTKVDVCSHSRYTLRHGKETLRPN